MNDNKRHLWQSLYETILKKLESAFPDWLKNTHNQDRLEKYQNAAIDVALGFSDMAVYGEYKHCTEIDLYESEKILHKSGIKTPKMPDGKLSEQRIGELVINKHSVDRVVKAIQYKPNPFIEAGNVLRMVNDTEIFLQNEIHKCYIEDNDLWNYKSYDYQTAIQNNEPRIESEWMKIYCDNITDIYGDDIESSIEKMGAYTPLGAKSDLYHAFAQLDGLYSRIQETRPDYTPEQCGELVSNIINHWQERNAECPLTSEQIVSHLGKLQGHHIEFEINRFSKESTLELSEPVINRESIFRTIGDKAIPNELVNSLRSVIQKNNPSYSHEDCDKEINKLVNNLFIDIGDMNGYYTGSYFVSGEVTHQDIIDGLNDYINKHDKSSINDKLLSLRSQLSSAIDEIDAVIGKNGQVQQNISTHEKQADEITQSRKFSGPTL